MRRFRFRAVFLLLACYVAVISFSISRMGDSLMVGGALEVDPLVIIDAGHGGFDGGAEGLGGIVEKDVNLPIALKLRDLLRAEGFRVIMTRESDVSTCDEGLGSISEKKTSDIMNRYEILKENPDAIYIGIHQNKFPESSSFGAQMFYGPRSEQSEILAGILQQNFRELLQPENKREPKKAENNIFLLYHAPIPAVLIECGFVSNPGDAAKLVDESYQNKLAYVISGSLLQYIEQGYYPQVEPEL